jgi:hypothetical protein
MCPALALRLTTTPAPAARRAARPAAPRPALPVSSPKEIEGLVVTEAWIAQLGGDR